VIEIVTCRNEADEQVSLDVWNDVWPHERVGLPEVHSYKAGLRDNVDLIARVDGNLAGSAVGGIEPQRPDLGTALVTVLREQRRCGVGMALYEAISTWARERTLDVVEAVVADDDPESLGFAHRRGFVEDRREKGVALRLAGIEPPRVERPDGIEIVTWAQRPELTRGIYEVAVEALPDIPGWEHELVEPFDDWLAHDMRGSGDRPEATFLAVAGDEVVGYAKFSLTDATPTIAHHDLTGVKHAWRGRGVARALKATQIAWAKENGYEELRTRNDERNAPIRKLNEDFGYRPTIGRIYLKGPLAGAAVADGRAGGARVSS
jgi:GNAT superfamily N-acetyltransferase